MMDQKILQILQNCKNIKQLNQTHLQILIHGLQEDSYLLRKLIDLSSAFGSPTYALRIFQNSHHPTVFVYNTFIKSLGESSGCRRDAFVAFGRMKRQQSDVSPNSFTLAFLLKSCDSAEAFEEGTQVHAQIVNSGYGSNVFVQNTLLDFYSKCGGGGGDFLGSALRVFEEMPERDVVSWNSMMSAYLSRGDMSSAVQLFESMPERNVVSWNSIVTALSKGVDMGLARSVFERMPVRNTISWNAVITGYVKCGDVAAARTVFDRMPEKDVVSWTAMISGYTKIGDLDSANDLFDKMPIKNVVSWNTMIAGYVQNQMFDRALHLFHQLLAGGELRPDEPTLTSVLSACAHLGALEPGSWVDSYINNNKFEITVTLGNALIDMYAKCGDLENAKAVFNRMSRRCIITWTTMVSGLAFNGQCGEALAVFDTMCRDKVEPDDVIFIAVLTACTHGGLVEEGLRIFDQMVKEFGIKPRIEHYGCVVDLLGRAGKLEEAIEFIESMPMEPNAVIWATLLGSCKTYGNEELVKFATGKILDLEPSNPAYQVLISNSNASIGQWEDAASARMVMEEERMEKMPGCSSVQVGSGVHEFLVKDTRHDNKKEMY